MWLFYFFFTLNTGINSNTSKIINYTVTSSVLLSNKHVHVPLHSLQEDSAELNGKCDSILIQHSSSHSVICFLLTTNFSKCMLPYVNSLSISPWKFKQHVSYYFLISSTDLEQFIGDDGQTSCVLLNATQSLALQHGVENLQEQLQRVLVQEVYLSK